MSWQDPAPGEREAGERAWGTVHSAYAERVAAPRRRDRRILFAVAAAVVVLAAALSPPGLAVWSSLRDAVSQEDHLLSLPASGRILVNGPAGVWIVQRDGSKRFLDGYAFASWSPHGLFLAAARGNQLVAMEPNGNVHWKLARPRPVGASQWSYEGFRIAYGAGKELRVVNGDGTGDRRLIADSVGRPFAWRPGTHQLAFVTARDRLVLMDVDRRRVLWRRHVGGLDQLTWSDDGRRLFAGKRVIDAAGHIVATFPRGSLTNGAFVPRSHALALVTGSAGANTVTVHSGPQYERHRVVFSGAGSFAGLAWSPDARWLLVDYRSADQWLFIRSAGIRRIAVRNIGNTFDSGPEHFAKLAGWCCP